MDASPQSYFAVVGRRWKLLALISLIPTALSVILVMFIVRPVYEGKTSVVFPLKRSSSFMRQSLSEMDIPVGIMTGIMDTTPTLYNHIAIIESRTLALKVAEYLKSEKDIDLLSTYPDILRNRDYRTDEERMRALAERMQKRVRVDDADRGLAVIIFLHTKPGIAAETANAYVEMTLKYLNELNQTAQADFSSFLENRQTEIEQQLEDVEQRIMQVKSETDILAVESTAEQIIRSYADIEALVAEAEIQAHGAMVRAQAMESAGMDMQDYYTWLAAGNNPQGEPPVPMMEALADAAISKLRGELSDLELQRQQTLLWATPDNPQVQALEAQIDSVRENLYREISDYSDASVAQLIVESTVYQAQYDVAEQVLGQLDARIDAFPPDERRLIELERDRNVYEAIYLVITQQLEQARIQELREESPFTVLDEALVPAKPVRPRKLVIILGTFAVAFWIGVLVSFSVDARQRGTTETGG
jgi:uncharacterized protein involved in exopolysaccharide biosynthesis